MRVSRRACLEQRTFHLRRRPLADYAIFILYSHAALVPHCLLFFLLVNKIQIFDILTQHLIFLALSSFMAPKKPEEPERKPLIGRVGTNLKMGIVGIPNVGKSTFFNVLTKSQAAAENFPFCTIEPNENKYILIL